VNKNGLGINGVGVKINGLQMEINGEVGTNGQLNRKLAKTNGEEVENEIIIGVMAGLDDFKFPME